MDPNANPYAPPSAEGWARAANGRVKIAACMGTRALLDWVLGPIAGVAVVLAYSPLYLAAWAVTGETRAVLWAMVASFVPLFAMSVWRLEADEAGLYFVRWMGGPRALRWSEIERIEPVGAVEAVVKGWLWPPLPMRQATPTATVVGCYAIRWQGRVRYFPAKDGAEFERVVRHFAPGVLARGAAA